MVVDDERFDFRPVRLALWISWSLALNVIIPIN